MLYHHHHHHHHTTPACTSPASLSLFLPLLFLDIFQVFLSKYSQSTTYYCLTVFLLLYGGLSPSLFHTTPTSLSLSESPPPNPLFSHLTHSPLPLCLLLSSSSTIIFISFSLAFNLPPCLVSFLRFLFGFVISALSFGLIFSSPPVFSLSLSPFSFANYAAIKKNKKQNKKTKKKEKKNTKRTAG